MQPETTSQAPNLEPQRNRRNANTEHHILKLDVSVYYLIVMEISQPAEKLLHDFDDHWARHEILFYYVEDRTALAELSHHIIEVVV